MSIESATHKSIDLICFSNLRWSFVFQRPYHLMSRFARHSRVYFVEEPVYEHTGGPAMLRRVCPQTGTVIVTPSLHEAHKGRDVHPLLKRLLDQFLKREKIRSYIAWFYTPMALDFAPQLSAELTIYDCMDEVSCLRGASAKLSENERRLLNQADLVFTGGVSLFEAKRNKHLHVYPFPSGVDVQHFAQARGIRETPDDQAGIPHPRLGYAGVIDDRIDRNLLDRMATLRPEWQFVMIGPVAKIDPESLPRRKNIHWLGMKDYRDLPSYLAGWDVGILPFAVNEVTRFTSPTKTPEYLAAGLSVVSTPIRDVVRPYGTLGLVRIAGTPEEFVLAAEHSMAFGLTMKWRRRVDAFLTTLSWDDTWSSMWKLISDALETKVFTPAVMTAGSSSAATSR
ncbi:MAG: UDP-galactopyranose mutase [Bryobacterales bacterium]|jgi:UDP-galactopyranose mutase|nr:UDP-galactopyranose mutase [Bryobacterales bacterium]